MNNSPNKFSFKVLLPSIVKGDIRTQFNKYLFSNQMLPYDDVNDLFQHNIMGYEIPDLGLTTVNQTSADGEHSQLGSLTTYDKYGSRRVEVDIRAVDGYLNYHLARYMYFLYSDPKLTEEENKTGLTLGDIIVDNNANDLFGYRVTYKNVLWLGVTGKKFDYNNIQQVEPDSFTLAFEHNGFDIEPRYNKFIAASKGV